jgi:hypothetical protein
MPVTKAATHRIHELGLDYSTAVSWALLGRTKGDFTTSGLNSWSNNLQLFIRNKTQSPRSISGAEASKI